MFWYECYECGYKPASLGDLDIHTFVTEHQNWVIVEDEN